MIKEETASLPHVIVWDERVRNRISTTDRYLYDLPFFAEIFNALDAEWKPHHATGWRIGDCHTLNDLFVVYGVRSKSGLKRHFAQHDHWLPIREDDEEADEGVVTRLHLVKTIDQVGFVRVWLDNNDTYKLADIGTALARGQRDFAQVLALTPFDRHIHIDGTDYDDDESTVVVVAAALSTGTTTKKEDKTEVDAKIRDKEAGLIQETEDMRNRLSVYLTATRDLRNALALSPLTHSDDECCEATRTGITLLYDELGHIEDQIEHIARCQVRFCKFMGQ